jgi:hypothetical protein
MADTILYDRATGAPTPFATPVEAEKAYLAGTHAPKAADRIPVVLQDGQVGTVPGAGIDDALKMGARIMPPDAYAEHLQEQARADAEKQVEDKIQRMPIWERVATGAVGSRQQAWQHGGLSGATAGLADVGITAGMRAAGQGEAAERYATHARQLEEAHPSITKAGELGGMVAGAAVGGAEAGAGGRMALGGLSRLLPSAAIDAAGGATERFLAEQAMGGIERSALGKAGVTGAKYAARGAVEGYGYGVGQALHEDAIGNGDHQLNAEKIFLTRGGEGALFGALGGGIGGGALSLAGSGLGKLAGAAAEKASTAKPLVGGESWLRGQADEFAARSFGMTSGQAKYADRTVEGGTKALGRHFLDELSSIDKGDELGVAVSRAFHEGDPERALNIVQEARKTTGKKLGEVLGSPVTVPATDIIHRIESVLQGFPEAAYAAPIAQIREQLVKPMAENLGIRYGMVPAERGAAPVVADTLSHGLGSQAERLAAAREAPAFTPKFDTMEGPAMQPGIVANPNVPLAQLAEERQALSKLAYAGQTLTPGAQKEFQQRISRALSELEGDALDRAAASAGTDSQRAELEALKSRYQKESRISEALEGRVARQDAHNRLSLGPVIGAVAQGSAHGMASGIATAVVMQGVKDRGNMVAAVLLDRLADLSAMQSAVKAADGKIAKAAQGIVRAGASGTKAALRAAASRETPATTREPVRYETAVAKVQRLGVDAQSFASDLQTTASIPHAPKTSMALASVLSNASSFIAGKLPAPNPPGNKLLVSLSGQSRPKPDEAEAAKFMRTYDALVHPDRILDRMGSHGDVTREQVEVLKTVAPGAFEEMRHKLVAEAMRAQEKGEPLPFETLQRIDLFFDEAILRANDPKVFQALQANVADTTDAPSGGGKAPAPRHSALGKFDTASSPYDRIEAKVGKM